MFLIFQYPLCNKFHRQLVDLQTWKLMNIANYGVRLHEELDIWLEVGEFFSSQPFLKGPPLRSLSLQVVLKGAVDLLQETLKEYKAVEGSRGSRTPGSTNWSLALWFLSSCVILLDSKGAVDLLQETLKEWKAVARLQGELGSLLHKSIILSFSFSVSFY